MKAITFIFTTDKNGETNMRWSGCDDKQELCALLSRAYDTMIELTIDEIDELTIDEIGELTIDEIGEHDVFQEANEILNP